MASVWYPSDDNPTWVVKNEKLGATYNMCYLCHMIVANVEVENVACSMFIEAAPGKTRIIHYPNGGFICVSEIILTIYGAYMIPMQTYSYPQGTMVEHVFDKSSIFVIGDNQALLVSSNGPVRGMRVLEEYKHLISNGLVGTVYDNKHIHSKNKLGFAYLPKSKRFINRATDRINVLDNNFNELVSYVDADDVAFT